MGRAIGIDLGTTNSVGAFSEVTIEVVINDRSNRLSDKKLTPSVVTTRSGQFIVGREAQNEAKNNPTNVIFSIKRLMGRGFADEKVQEVMEKVGYRITPSTNGTENSLSVWIEDKEYQPEDISAAILKQVVQNAIEYRGRGNEEITQAVITIPAYFNDKQKQATRSAAYRCGLTPLELLPEPTAAAISYDFTPDSTDAKTILVYDFGGGTFDASLITATGTDFIESGKAGDLWLGGDNIDERLIDYVKKQIQEEYGLNDIDQLIENMPFRDRVLFKFNLKDAVEKAKIELSFQEQAVIQPSTHLLDEDGCIIPIEVSISRQKFEEIIQDIVNRTVQICHETLRISEYTPDLVDVFLLVGGSSLIPLVQRKMKEAFGEDKVVVHPRPMYAVAEGAAIMAAKKVNKVGTVSRDYCIKLANNSLNLEISRGEVLPVIKSKVYKTVCDNQRLVHFEFFSPDRVAEQLDSHQQNDRIGDLWLPISEDLPKGTEIVVFYELDEKETELKVSAYLRNKPSVKVQTSISRGKSDEVFYKKIEEFIEGINNDSFLTQYGIDEVSSRLTLVFKKVGYIIDQNTGQECQDIRTEVETEFNKIKREFSKSFIALQDLGTELSFLLDLSDNLVPPAHKQKLKSCQNEINRALQAGIESQIEGIYEEVKRELSALPEQTQLIMYLKYDISVCSESHPEHRDFLSSRFSDFLLGLKTDNRTLVQTAYKEIELVLSQYSSSNYSPAKLVTGIGL